MADDGSYRTMLADVASMLSDKDAKNIAFEAITDRAVRSQITDGITLMDQLDSARLVSKSDVDFLLGILSRRNLHQAAEEVKLYKEKFISNTNPASTVTITNRNEGAAAGGNGAQTVDKNYLLTLSKKVGKKWRDVGRYLDFDEAELDAFVDNNPRNQQEVIKQMFNEWLETRASNATYGRLATALRKAGRTDLAETCHP